MQEQQTVNEQFEPQESEPLQKLSWEEYHTVVNDALKEGNPICLTCE